MELNTLLHAETRGHTMTVRRESLSRRNLLRLAAAGGAAGILGLAGHAQDPTPPPGTDTGAEFVTPETQAAIDRGLAFLARTQLADGAFLDRTSGASVGVTALAGLALMAAGHQPGRGQYGRNVSRAVDFVLAAGNGPIPGFLASADSQNATRGLGQQQSMYSHGFGSLFLAEVCGMLPDRDRQAKVRAMLEQAVTFAVGAQNKEGGWRYDPRPAVVADVSVTVAQMMAFRAAKNAGIAVRKGVIDAAVQFIRDCQTADGGFSYFKGPGASSFARSAAALVGLFSAGIYEGRDIDRGLRYVQQFLPGRQYSFREIPPQYYYYGQYYAALAMWTAGTEYWSQWFPAIRDELLVRARASDGKWTDNTYGAAYATAMSLIVLQLPNNYLPILQK